MKLTYRPEIDGLRAIAVGAVILYHAQITIFGHETLKGGFIGVDIFFVISGYLITSIILKELVNSGTFSFKFFYERRIRRILPVLLFVMLVSLPFGWKFLLPDSFIDFSKSILYSLGFSSNFYFHYSGQQYAAQSGLFKPFLHTWSLSVEEQYYILFPIILFITFKYFKKYLIYILIFGFFLSLGLADWTSKKYPSASFYFLHTRIWELLAGSILAYFEITLGHRSKHEKINKILPTIGVLLIGHAFIFYNNEMFHPSLYTLSPIIGVCIIIWFSQKDELVTKILSSKLFVSIGLISYSLYLWHYPVFAFARYTAFTEGDILKKIYLIFIIFGLSLISYYLIEKKFRNLSFKFSKQFKYILSSFIFIIIFVLLVIKNSGFTSRLPPILQNELSFEIPWVLLKNKKGQDCHDNLNGCQFFGKNNKNIFFIGDSHMSSILYDLINRDDLKSYNIHTYTFGGCSYFPYFSRIDIKTNKISELCNTETIEKIKNAILDKNNSLIVSFSRLPLYFSLERFNNEEGGIEGGKINWGHKFTNSGEILYKNLEDSYVDEMLLLANNGHKIILIYPYPEAGWHVPTRLASMLPKWWNNIPTFLENPLNFLSTSFEVYIKRTAHTKKILSKLNHPNITFIYPHTLICNTLLKNRCLNHDDKNLYYRDDDHPSEYTSKKINDLLISKIKKINY